MIYMQCHSIIHNFKTSCIVKSLHLRVCFPEKSSGSIAGPWLGDVYNQSGTLWGLLTIDSSPQVFACLLSVEKL